jgi:thymidylate synthase (FAD)
MEIKAFVLARPRFEPAYQAFLDDFLPEGERGWRQSEEATPAERLVEFAGRVCYMSFGPRQSPTTNAEYIRKLVRNGHDSVLEHAVWTVVLSGVSRALTHQFVRHRIGFSYSQLSQQYHDESEARFVRPAVLERFPELGELWDLAMNNSQSAYRRILSKLNAAPDETLSRDKREAIRAMRSAARSVLPNATETVLVTTFNARSLRHFLQIRGSTMGDSEMRCVSAALLAAVRADGPALFFDFAIEDAADGLPIVIHRPMAEA